MVAGQVREDRRAEMKVVDAPERERVRGGLHHACATPLGDHLAKHPVQFGRFGRRPRGCHFAVGDVVANRTDAAAPDAGRFEDRREEIRRSGLPVGPSDADENEIGAGVAVESCRKRGQRKAGIRYLLPRNCDVRRRSGFGNDGDGAARDRFAGKADAVGLEAPQCHEDRAGNDLPGIARDRRDCRGGRAIGERHSGLCVERCPAGSGLQEVTERHWELRYEEAVGGRASAHTRYQERGRCPAPATARARSHLR